MTQLHRKQFLHNLVILLGGYFLLPKISRAGSFFRKPIVFEMNQYAIIDLHCHPSLKMYLLNRKMWKAHLLKNPGSNIVHMQEDTKELIAGNVRGMIAMHYLVEIGIRKYWTTVKNLWPALEFLLFPTTDKIEHGDYSNFTQINIMIDTLESQIHIVNDRFKKNKDPIQFVIARSYDDFEKALTNKNNPLTIPIAHAIEGAHALGLNNFPVEEARMSGMSEKEIAFFQQGDGFMKNGNGDNPVWYKRNLRALRDRGVCMMTLSHFFKNDLAYPVDGMSEDSKKYPE